MAVGKSKKSRSKSKMRRSGVRVFMPTLTEDQFTGEVHLRHHVTDQGYYKGKQVIKVKPTKAKEDSE
jgi:large subunit ribosomal protein L32